MSVFQKSPSFASIFDFAHHYQCSPYCHWTASTAQWLKFDFCKSAYAVSNLIFTWPPWEKLTALNMLMGHRAGIYAWSFKFLVYIFSVMGCRALIFHRRTAQEQVMAQKQRGQVIFKFAAVVISNPFKILNKFWELDKFVGI